jgi:hypothetical protein
LALILLVTDLVWEVIGDVTTGATKQADDYDCEPPVHLVILSKAVSLSIGSAGATVLDFQSKRKNRPSKRTTNAIIPIRWDDRSDPEQTELAGTARVILSAGSSMFHRLVFMPNAFVTSERDRLTASLTESANTQCRNRSGPPTRLHQMQYDCDCWQFSVETGPFMITPLYELTLLSSVI